MYVLIPRPIKSSRSYYTNGILLVKALWYKPEGRWLIPAEVIEFFQFT
jgi:hypothetical protein